MVAQDDKTIDEAPAPDDKTIDEAPAQDDKTIDEAVLRMTMDSGGAGRSVAGPKTKCRGSAKKG